MKHYETIFIINPNLGDEEYGEVLSKFRDLIDKSKGVIVKVDEWGKQKLAYRLKKFDSAVYVLVDYCGDPRRWLVRRPYITHIGHYRARQHGGGLPAY